MYSYIILYVVAAVYTSQLCNIAAVPCYFLRYDQFFVQRRRRVTIGVMGLPRVWKDSLCSGLVAAVSLDSSR